MTTAKAAIRLPGLNINTAIALSNEVSTLACYSLLLKMKILQTELCGDIITGC